MSPQHKSSRHGLIVFILAHAILLAGCSLKSKPNRNGVAQQALSNGVSMTVNAVPLQDRRIRIEGSTNLPTDTNLLVDVKDVGETDCLVLADGSFHTEALGSSTGVQDGIYTADVVMPLPKTQPRRVRRIIGDSGENLSGPLIEKDTFGVTVRFRKNFTIGSADAIQQRTKRIVEEHQYFYNAILNLDQRLQYARMQGWLGDPKDMQKLAEWGQFARQFNQDLQKVQDQAMAAQPMSARAEIGIALGDLGSMFRATAFEEHADYEAAKVQYEKSLNELRRFIEAESR